MLPSPQNMPGGGRRGLVACLGYFFRLSRAWVALSLAVSAASLDLSAALVAASLISAPISLALSVALLAVLSADCLAESIVVGAPVDGAVGVSDFLSQPMAVTAAVARVAEQSHLSDARIGVSCWNFPVQRPRRHRG